MPYPLGYRVYIIIFNYEKKSSSKNSILSDSHIFDIRDWGQSKQSSANIYWLGPNYK